MFDNTYFYLMIVVLLFAIGDLIGYIKRKIVRYDDGYADVPYGIFG